MAGLIERVKWRIADLLMWLPNRCWSQVADWPLGYKRWPLPSRINDRCRRDAEVAGRCYCGTVGSDGTVLRRGETVCVTPMPGRASDRMCSRPDGHDGFHRCGGVEWGPVADA